MTPLTRLIPISLVLCLPLMTEAQAPYTKGYVFGREDYLYQGTILDSLNSSVAVGYLTRGQNTRVVVRLDDQGNFVWSKAQDTLSSDYFSFDLVDHIGNSIISAGDNGNSEPQILRLDENAGTQWAKGYPTTGFDPVEFMALATDSAGNIYVGGQHQGLIWQYDAFLAKISGADGSVAWASINGDTLMQSILAVAPVPGGGVAAAGITETPPNWGYSRVFVQRYSDTGSLQWTRSLTLPLDAKPEFIHATATAIYVAGDQYNFIEVAPFVAKYDHNGNLIHCVQFPPAPDEANLTGFKANGDGFLMTWATYGSSVPAQGMIGRIDSSLSMVWWRFFEDLIPLGLSGVDPYNMIHVVGSYAQGDEAVGVCGTPNLPVSAIPCGQAIGSINSAAVNAISANYALTPGSITLAPYSIQPSLIDMPLTNVYTCTATSSRVSAPVELRAWPNPSPGRFLLNVEKAEGVSMAGASWMVRGMDGQTVLQGQMEQGQTAIDLRAFPAGIYTLNVQSEAGATHIKLVKVD